MIISLIWRNLWRNKRRTIITGGSVAFAVFFAILMQSFQFGIFNHLIRNMVGLYTGYIQIHRKGYWEEQVIDNAFESTDSLLGVIEQSGVVGTIPRLEIFMLASGLETTKGVFLVGTDPGLEDRFSKLSTRVIQGKYFAHGADEVMIGEGLARKLNLAVGDSIVLIGQGYHEIMAAGKYPICGLIKLATPKMDDGFIYMPIETARSLLGAEQMCTSLSLVLPVPQDMGSIEKSLKSTLKGDYEVMNWEELLPDISNHIKSDAASFYIFTGVLYLIIGFGFYGTTLMMMAERKFELGMLIAIGMKKHLLSWVINGELLFMTVGGALAGIAISVPLVYYLSVHPITLEGEVARAYTQFGFDPVLPTELNLKIIVIQTCIVSVIALVVSLYPFWHIHKLDPVSAMKK